MRTNIKFRAVDIKKKHWINVGFHLFGECTMFDVLNQYSLADWDDIEVGECLNRKDGNNKYIYEGDIVEYQNNNSSVVFHGNVEYNANLCCFEIVVNENERHGFYPEGEGKYFIVGNKYGLDFVEDGYYGHKNR